MSVNMSCDSRHLNRCRSFVQYLQVIVGFRTERTPSCVVVSSVRFAVASWVPHLRANNCGLKELRRLGVWTNLMKTGSLPLDAILGVRVLTVLDKANPKYVAGCSPWGSVCNAAIMRPFPHLTSLSISLPAESVIDSSWGLNRVVRGSHSGPFTVISIRKSGTDHSYSSLVGLIEGK